MSAEAIGIGTRVWYFDHNRRVYGTDNSRPIFERHFQPWIIVGEEGRSWLLESEGGPYAAKGKVGKTSLLKKYCTDAERESRIWLNAHRGRLTDAVRRCSDLPTLREIARLVGYSEEANRG